MKEAKTWSRSRRQIDDPRADVARRMAEAGEYQGDIAKAIGMSPSGGGISDFLKFHGIVANKRVRSWGTGKKRVFSDDEVALLKELAEAGAGKNRMCRELHIGRDRIDGVLADLNIKVVRRKPWSRRPVPVVSHTDLDIAVNKLRTRYPIVCSEHTIAHPYNRPYQYAAGTLFRVGNRRNVTAAELLRLANG